MKPQIKLGVVAILVIFIPLVVCDSPYESIPNLFFVDSNGHQNCLIVVGEQAAASDIIEASQLAIAIGQLFSQKKEIPVVEEVSVAYEDVPPDTCIVVTPLELPTLWYFDDFGVYGNGNDRFELWETHEEIQLHIEDIPEYDPLLGVFKGNGYLDFSTIYRIDNVRSPPYVWVDSYMEAAKGQYITGLHYQEKRSYGMVHPYFVYNGYIPEICLFDTVYEVIYIDSSVLITGTPHLEYVYLYENEPCRAGEFTISLLDVDADHNKCFLQVEGAGIREEFWMILDPLHGFSSNIQEMGSEVVAVDFDNDGVVDYFDKATTGLSELDVWGHTLSGHGIADLVVDGIKTFIGEDIGVYLGVYWVEDAVVWREKTCCDPFVKYPQFYDFQIRPQIVAAKVSQDAYVDQGLPLANFGGLSSLSVRSFLNTNTRSFVQFDLPELPSEAIVQKATLRLVPITVPGARTYDVSRVTSAWSETAITWANQPAAILTGTQLNNVMEWDVTTDVQAFYSGTPNYGWRISDQTENSVLPYEILFGSRESFSKPQ